MAFAIRENQSWLSVSGMNVHLLATYVDEMNLLVLMNNMDLLRIEVKERCNKLVKGVGFSVLRKGLRARWC